jgi:FtsP/CotA-like multicopper oxidase with cupredoxin domain
MNRTERFLIYGVSMCLAFFGPAPAFAEIFSQCPADTDGIDTDGDGIANNDHLCLHVTSGDGFIRMGDGRIQYMFGFHDVTGLPDSDVMMEGMVAAELPGPTVVLHEGQKVYWSLSNVGMMQRPDLFDPHSIHFHGFPNAASIFDGVPEVSMVIHMGSTITYFYNIVDPGTYMWHCHVEATEHMQMGMLGNLYVLPKQNNLPNLTILGSFTHHTGYKYVYNDGDGSTYYDVEYPIQLHSLDPRFHDASMLVQPLPFAKMHDTYPMLNGRGYPDTVDTFPAGMLNTADQAGFEQKYSQRVHSLIRVPQGQKVLLRLSGLAMEAYGITVLGIPMRIVGRDAKLLRGPAPNFKDLSYTTSTVTVSGGTSFDAILDTTGIAEGTYFLYTTNLNNLSNDLEDFGGMMTEVVVCPSGGCPPLAAAQAQDVGTTSRAPAGSRNGPAKRATGSRTTE